MTLLSIIKDGLSECGDTPIPASVINNDDETAQKALAIVKGLGRDLLREYKWPALKTTYTFVTVPNQPGYALPADLQRIVPNTVWDRTAKWRLNGPATDSQWQRLQSGLVTSLQRLWFRFEGSNIVLGPTPTDVRTIAFDYYKNTWVSSAGGAPQNTFLADTDIPVFMPNGNAEDLLRLGLIYKWKSSSSLPYADDKANYISAIDADTFDSQAFGKIDVTGMRRHGRDGNLPDSGYGL